jgi:hypothetical protein
VNNERRAKLSDAATGHPPHRQKGLAFVAQQLDLLLQHLRQRLPSVPSTASRLGVLPRHTAVNLDDQSLAPARRGRGVVIVCAQRKVSCLAALVASHAQCPAIAPRRLNQSGCLGASFSTTSARMARS